MLKNVSLLQTYKNGKTSWRLLGPTGAELECFQIFADSLLRKYPKSTRAIYCQHLAEFINYLYEAASVLIGNEGELKFTRSLLEDIIEAYDEFLVYGLDSGNVIASLVACSMPSPRNKRVTSALKHAPIRKFLSMSERVHLQTIELIEAGLSTRIEEESAIFPSTSLKTAPSSIQRKAILVNSMISGVIAGGPKLLQSALLPTITPQAKYEEGRAFPFDKVCEFIDALHTHRDKAIYSLYAASGCRSHEGLQILIGDIDIESGSVNLVDPATRPNNKSYLYLSHQEREELAWKGRTTSLTMLIEPFASRFFQEFEKYLKNEYIPHGLHQFAFQYLSKKSLGKPYFLSHADSRADIFHTARDKCGIDEIIHGPHSLRHAYGTYLLNYFPRAGGEYGLPIGLVQQMMGHAELKTTQKYARHDKDLYSTELVYANNMIFGNGAHKSILQIKKEMLQMQLNKIEKLLANEQIGKNK